MSEYKYILNKRTGRHDLVPTNVVMSFKSGVASAATLPTEGNVASDARITADDQHLYVWDGSAWQDQGDIIDLYWTAIVGKPSSSVEDIDDAVNKSKSIINPLTGNINELLHLRGRDYSQYQKDKIKEIYVRGDIDVNSFANDDDYLYITTGGLGNMYKVAKTDINTKVATSTDTGTNAIINSGDYIYGTYSRYIRKYNKSDLSSHSYAQFGNSSFARSIVTDGTYFYVIQLHFTPILYKIDANLNLIGSINIPHGLPIEECLTITDGYLFIKTASSPSEIGITKVDLTSFAEVQFASFSGWLASNLGKIDSISPYIYFCSQNSIGEGSLVKLDLNLNIISNTIPSNVGWKPNICIDGTNIYYFVQDKIEKYDTNLNLIERANILSNADVRTSIADDNNVFIGLSYGTTVSTWHKLSKISIVIEDTGYGVQEIESSPANKIDLPCDGSYIYYANSQKLHKVAIDTFEDFSNNLVLQTGNSLSSGLCVDDNYIYLSSYILTSPYTGRIYKFDKKTLTPASVPYSAILINGRPSYISQDLENIYVTGQGSSIIPGKIFKLRKSDLTLQATYSTENVNIRDLMNIVVNNNELYLLIRAKSNSSNGHSLVIRVDSETMTQTGICEYPDVSRALSAIRFDGQYLYYCTTSGWVGQEHIKIDISTMTIKSRFAHDGQYLGFFCEVLDNILIVGSTGEADLAENEVKICAYDKNTHEKLYEHKIIFPYNAKTAEISWAGFTIYKQTAFFITGQSRDYYLVRTPIIDPNWNHRADSQFNKAIDKEIYTLEEKTTIEDNDVSLIESCTPVDVWTERKPAGDYRLNWTTITSDYPGSNLLAGVYGGRLYKSADYGITWTETQPAGDVDKNWIVTASDSDGSFLAASVRYGRLYISNDSGITWTETQPAGDVDKNLWYIDINNDGSKIVANAEGVVYFSDDYGVTWYDRTPPGMAYTIWSRIAISGDGTKIIVSSHFRLYVSSDSGITWTETQPAGDVDLGWDKVDISFGGNFIVATVWNGRIYTSDDFGITWKERFPIGYGADLGYSSVKLSHWGSGIIISIGNYGIYTSEDYGVTWKKQEPCGLRIIYNVENTSCSADFKILGAVSSGSQRIFTSVKTETYPKKKIKFSNIKNTDSALRTDKLTVDETGNTTVVGELKIKVYEQAEEPTLGASQRLAMWVDTDDNYRVYLIFRRGIEGSGLTEQVKRELI